jgi:hypothetical protein
VAIDPYGDKFKIGLKKKLGEKPVDPGDRPAEIANVSSGIRTMANREELDNYDNKKDAYDNDLKIYNSKVEFNNKIDSRLKLMNSLLGDNPVEIDKEGYIQWVEKPRGNAKKIGFIGVINEVIAHDDDISFSESVKKGSKLYEGDKLVRIDSEYFNDMVKSGAYGSTIAIAIIGGALVSQTLENPLVIIMKWKYYF